MSQSEDDFKFDADDLPVEESEDEVPEEAKIKSKESPDPKDWATFVVLSLLTVAVMFAPLGMYYLAGFEWAVMSVLSVVWFTCLQMLR